jgi:hypothetical protein
MATKREVEKRASKELAAFKTRAQRLLSKEFGTVKISTKAPKDAAHRFTYKIDDARSLIIDISITPVVSAPTAQMIIKPGKDP